MSKTVVLHPFPRPVALGCDLPAALTPNPRAARAIGRPAASLEGLGRRIVEATGARRAGPLVSQAMLAQAAGAWPGCADREGMARVLQGPVSEILRAGLLDRQAPAPGSDRFKALLDVTRAYRENLRRFSTGPLVDSAEVVRIASGKADRRQPYLVYGYPRLGQGEIDLLDAVCADGSLVVLPWIEGHSAVRENEQTARLLSERGWSVRTEKADPGNAGERLSLKLAGVPGCYPAQGDLDAIAYPNDEAEIRGVLGSALRLLKAGASANSIALVARDDASIGPLVLRVAWEYGVPVRAFYSVPLIETRLGAWLKQLCSLLIEGTAFEGVFRLLASPLGPGLDEEQAGAVRKEHPWKLAAWARLGVDPGLLEWPERASRDEMVRRLRDMMVHLNHRSKTGNRAQDAIAFSKLDEALTELETLLPESLSPPEIAAHILSMLNIVTAPAAPGRGGIELHTPLSLYGASYDHVFVLGASEGSLPALVRDDCVLDYFERMRLQEEGIPLEGPVEAVQREWLSTWSAIQSCTARLRLSYARSSGKDTLDPGPLFLDLGVRPVDPPEAAPSSVEEYRQAALGFPGVGLTTAGDQDDPVLPNTLVACKVEMKRESTEPADEYDGCIGPGPHAGNRTFSASQITTLGQCPFHWFAGRMLGLADPDEADDEIDPLTRGSFYHSVLQRLAKPLLGQAGDPRQGMIDGLQAAVDTAAAELGLDRRPAWPARREELATTVRRAIQADAFIDDGASIRTVEQWFEGMWRELPVRGRVDRIDETPGGLAVADYKSGSTVQFAKNADGKAKLDVQLAIYSEVAVPHLYPDPDAVVAKPRYYSVRKAQDIAVPRGASEPQALDDLVERIKESLDTGAFVVAPDLDETACRYCEMDPVCRHAGRPIKEAAQPCA